MLKKNVCLKQEGINSRNAFRCVKEKSDQLEVGWFTLLHGSCEARRAGKVHFRPEKESGSQGDL